jgi:hypothetical protein
MFLAGKNRFLYITVALLYFAYMLASCESAKRTSVKNYQLGKPFVFDNKIILKGKVSKDEKKRLTEELNNYWQDSLRVKKLQQFGFLYTLKKPPVFDSANIYRSQKFMNAYLNSQGYYYANFDTFIVKIDTTKKKKQYRTFITQIISVGKNITIDSVSYTLTDSSIQSFAKAELSNSFLKKGKPYTKQIISDELDRLVNIFRQNGYYKFSREDIYALVDTANEKLFKLTLDPIEQAKLIAQADSQRKANPQWDIDIRQRDVKDSTKLRRYLVGNIYYYPETKFSDFPDSLIKKNWPRELKNKKGDLIIRDYVGKFKIRPLREHTYLRRDSVNGYYNEELYFKSVNTLSQIPAWKQVDARVIQRGKDTVDIHFFLEPAIKQGMTYNLETSRNSNDFSSGNLLGLSLSTTYTNRNVLKQAIQSNTNLRAGIELNFDTATNSKNLVQSFQIGLGHSYSFPRLILPTRLMNPIFRKADNRRTVIAANASYLERFNTYRLRQGIASYTWEWRKKNSIFSWKPINMELYTIDTLPLLYTIFQQNPFLRNSFNTGNVFGGSATWTALIPSKKNKNISRQLRLGIDESGFLFAPLIPIPLSVVKDLDEKIYKYIKLELDYKFNQKFPKSELAIHFFTGAGIPLGGNSLPFFKQFSAGGPNSMRAWGLRQLGLGSSLASDTIAANSFRDRFGDLQIETNIEYRFLLANIGGFKIGSALYADIGNLWNIKRDNANPNAEFSLDRFTKDLAVGVGTGLRFDFSYFLIRVDFAYKLKDPGRNYNNGWIKDFNWTETRNNQSKTEVRNYAFQLGIGLPF